MTAYNWPAIGRELVTNRVARELCGGVPRSELIRWRERATNPFPRPVLVVHGAGHPIDLWARTEVAAWLERENARRASRPSASRP